MPSDTNDQGEAAATVMGKPVRIVCAATPEGVRAALATAHRATRGLNLGPAAWQNIEIVLAEVMNNIVEHAYAGRNDASIEVSFVAAPGKLDCVTRDSGNAMPDGRAPEGILRPLSDKLEELPEGGFGWYLIRQLTERMEYRRVDDRNELNFSIPLN
ncbi:MAG: ATP-binding protein [Pseudomonadota bacterium]